MKSGIIDKVEIVSYPHNISNYFYIINGKSYSCHDIYIDENDYIKRTSPKRELKENERYIMTRYMIQQNHLIPVKVEQLTNTHSIVKSNYSYNEKIRSSFLYTSKDKFYNKMLAQLDTYLVKKSLKRIK